MSLMAKAMGVKVGNSLRKLVLIKLADNANDKGECWPSYQHIADQCECSRTAVRKGVSIETELLNFRDYHLSRGTLLIDWNSAFRVWIRNARVNPLAKRGRAGQETPHWNSREGWEDFL